jgi:hypothetical protein
MLKPSSGDLTNQLDLLRLGVLTATTTIQKLKSRQNVDADAILQQLASIRAEAEEVRDAFLRGPA